VVARSAVADQVGRVLVDRYRLLAPIGVGASGRVYLADDVRLRRRVAVKVLQPGLADDAGFVRRFRSEAQLAASLHHPNVMAVYDWGQDDGVAFMVVELLRGGSLRALLDTGTLLTPAQSLQVGGQVAVALQYAHARGLVHRDIKPANLLFDEHGVVRVGDFGLARALAEAAWTEPVGALVGTARYAAPEQGGAVPPDARADLYSLAVVLVEACTGEVPVVADTPIGTLAARTVRGIVAPPELGALGAVIERAGRPQRTERYPDAATMGAALSDAARRFPPPDPLPLAGLGEEALDADPTRLGATALTSPALRRETSGTVDDAERLAVPVHVPPGRRTSIVPYAVGAAIVAAIVVVAALLLSGGSSGSVAAPTLIGRLEPTAGTAATNAGVLMKVVERRRADDPSGLVIQQTPMPGSFLGNGGEIDVVVSRGPPPVPVPVVAQRSVTDAQTILTQAGFVTTIDRRYDETIPKDVVISSDPPGAGLATPESTVKLIVSNGPAPVQIPDVSGHSPADASQILSAKHLTPAARNAFSDTVPVGQVIGTDPPSGTQVPRDSTVAVLVSQGPQMVAVPNELGQSVDTASQDLRAAGLVPNVQNFGPGGRVRAQDPPAGTMVKKGASVTLFL
jgi:beta-lactam-binding protein with PASTA domain/tRNA A-37 threonylcarbamoyl transferase component Bud32